MSDDNITAEERRAAHRRGHSSSMYERVRRDSQVADALSPQDSTTRYPIVGPLTDGQVLTVSGGTIVSAPGGGGGSGDITEVTTSGTSGLSGGATSGAVALAVVRGTSVNQTRHGNDAAYTDARTPVAHVHAQSDVTGLVTALSGKANTSHTHAQSDITNLVTDLAGKAASSHGHTAAETTSGTFALARMTAGAANQSLRVNSAGTAVEGFWPEADALRSILSSPVAVSTTPATVFTFSIPAAGTYAIDATFVTQAGTLSVNRVVAWSFAHASVTGCQIGWAQSTSVSTSNAFGYGANFGTALPAVAFAGTQDNVFSSVRCWGDFSVSASGNLTVSVVIDGDTASCLAGTFMRIRRVA